MNRLKVFPHELCVTAQRSCLSFVRGLAEAVGDAKDDVGVGRTYPRLAAQEHGGAETVVAGCVKDIARHKSQLQFAALFRPEP